MEPERPLPPAAEELLERIRSRTAWVGIVGLGYVGLPLALAFAERGFPVLGFDVDPAKVEAPSHGECYILDADRVRAQTGTGRLAATHDFDRLADLRYVRTTAEKSGCAGVSS